MISLFIFCLPPFLPLSLPLSSSSPQIGHATSPPPLPPFSDPALKDLTLRCLEVKPEERPTSSELLKHPLFTSA